MEPNGEIAYIRYVAMLEAYSVGNSVDSELVQKRQLYNYLLSDAKFSGESRSHIRI